MRHVKKNNVYDNSMIHIPIYIYMYIHIYEKRLVNDGIFKPIKDLTIPKRFQGSSITPYRPSNQFFFMAQVVSGPKAFFGSPMISRFFL